MIFRFVYFGKRTGVPRIPIVLADIVFQMFSLSIWMRSSIGCFQIFILNDGKRMRIWFQNELQTLNDFWVKIKMCFSLLIFFSRQIVPLYPFSDIALRLYTFSLNPPLIIEFDKKPKKNPVICSVRIVSPSLFNIEFC